MKSEKSTVKIPDDPSPSYPASAVFENKICMSPATQKLKAIQQWNVCIIPHRRYNDPQWSGDNPDFEGNSSYLQARNTQFFDPE